MVIPSQFCSLSRQRAGGGKRFWFQIEIEAQSGSGRGKQERWQPKRLLEP
jgi:hypothetical protein